VRLALKFGVSLSQLADWHSDLVVFGDLQVEQVIWRVLLALRLGFASDYDNEVMVMVRMFAAFSLFC